MDDLRNWVNYNSDYPGTVHTPHIDALAAVSTRYLNAYATVPQCAPSRLSVMMGLSPATHGLTRPSFGTGDPAYDRIYNDPSLKSLPEVLRDRGYHTAVTGKVFNSPKPERWSESGPATIISTLHSGFDAGPDRTFLIPSVTPELEKHPDQKVADWSSAFLTGYDGAKPFFLAVGFYLPHIPWQVPQWAYDLYPLEQVIPHRPLAGDLGDEPAQAVALAAEPVLEHGRTQYQTIALADKAAAYTQAYLAAISHTDAMVGQVLGALAASAHAENTDIIFWSDHGFISGRNSTGAKIRCGNRPSRCRCWSAHGRIRSIPRAT